MASTHAVCPQTFVQRTANGSYADRAVVERKRDNDSFLKLM